MKKYLIISAKVVILISLIATSFAYSTGLAFITLFLSMLISPQFLTGDLTRSGRNGLGQRTWYNYWSSDDIRRKWYARVYLVNVILFIAISLYTPISKNIKEQQYQNSIAKSMKYTETGEYKQKQEVFKQQFIAMQERARGK